MPADPVQPYISYLLRVWRVQEQGRMVCRATLEAIATGERVGFDDLADLAPFLESQVAAKGETDTASQIP